MATKYKKDTKSEFPSPGGSGVSREVGQKFEHCKIALGVCLRSDQKFKHTSGGQEFSDKNLTIVRILELMRFKCCWSLE